MLLFFPLDLIFFFLILRSPSSTNRARALFWLMWWIHTPPKKNHIFSTRWMFHSRLSITRCFTLIESSSLRSRSLLCLSTMPKLTPGESQEHADREQAELQWIVTRISTKISSYRSRSRGNKFFINQQITILGNYHIGNMDYVKTSTEKREKNERKKFSTYHRSHVLGIHLGKMLKRWLDGIRALWLYTHFSCLQVPQTNSRNTEKSSRERKEWKEGNGNSKQPTTCPFSY